MFFSLFLFLYNKIVDPPKVVSFLTARTVHGSSSDEDDSAHGRDVHESETDHSLGPSEEVSATAPVDSTLAVEEEIRRDDFEVAAVDDDVSDRDSDSPTDTGKRNEQVNITEELLLAEKIERRQVDEGRDVVSLVADYDSDSESSSDSGSSMKSYVTCVTSVNSVVKVKSLGTAPMKLVENGGERASLLPDERVDDSEDTFLTCDWVNIGTGAWLFDLM